MLSYQLLNKWDIGGTKHQRHFAYSFHMINKNPLTTIAFYCYYSDEHSKVDLFKILENI